MKKLSIVLSDYGVRENFHTPLFLNKQSAFRDEYEIIWVELYDKVNPIILDYYKRGIIDKLIIIKSIREKYQKRQLTYNHGIIQSEAELICFLDADVMCSWFFIDKIYDSFNRYPNMIMFMDEIRHADIKDIDLEKRMTNFLDLERPSVWVNWNTNKKLTSGLIDLQSRSSQMVLRSKQEILTGHNIRNYGACMIAKRKDLIEVLGADESSKFDGLSNGPWGMGWRILNCHPDYIEYWHPNEMILHVWHPGSDGSDDENKVPEYREGMNPGEACHWPKVFMNYYSIKNFLDGKKFPEKPNPVIVKLREEMFK